MFQLPPPSLWSCHFPSDLSNDQQPHPARMRTRYFPIRKAQTHTHMNERTNEVPMTPMRLSIVRYNILMRCLFTLDGPQQCEDWSLNEFPAKRVLSVFLFFFDCQLRLAGGERHRTFASGRTMYQDLERCLRIQGKDTARL